MFQSIAFFVGIMAYVKLFIEGLLFECFPKLIIIINSSFFFHPKMASCLQSYLITVHGREWIVQLSMVSVVEIERKVIISLKLESRSTPTNFTTSQYILLNRMSSNNSLFSWLWWMPNSRLWLYVFWSLIIFQFYWIDLTTIFTLTDCFYFYHLN